MKKKEITTGKTSNLNIYNLEDFRSKEDNIYLKKTRLKDGFKEGLELVGIGAFVGGVAIGAKEYMYRALDFSSDDFAIKFFNVLIGIGSVALTVGAISCLISGMKLALVKNKIDDLEIARLDKEDKENTYTKVK